MTVLNRLLVLVPIGGMLLVALSLALLATSLAATTSWGAFQDVAAGDASTTELKTEFLGIASLTLQAVVFYLVGIGLYALFVGPVKTRRAIVPQSLADLEIKVVSVVIVILATTFLERFTSSTDSRGMLELAAALALAIPALVLFQWYLGREKFPPPPFPPESGRHAETDVGALPSEGG